MAKNNNLHGIELLSPYDEESGAVVAVVETPKHGHNKFKYDVKTGLFKLAKVLPEGMNFPFDFGFIPGTMGGDGDPLDVLILMDEPAFVGCYLTVRLVGVIEATQEEKGKKEKNDRLVAVATESRLHKGIKHLTDLNPNFVEEIERFFIAYNEAGGKKFTVDNCGGTRRAAELLEQSIRMYKSQRKEKGAA
jgi:inorganic pyrophosphatase